jgi:iron(III) transport system ATP-binding protein
MTMLTVNSLSRTFSGQPAALSDVSLSIAPSERVVILGPSGSGKSTLLRCIAGLEDADAGSVLLNQRTLFDAATGFSAPPWSRKIGMVLQDLGLWPHMTALQNVEFPLRFGTRKIGRKKARDLAMDALSRVHMERYAIRYPFELSGGERQRVAIARALVDAPMLLLMDEPFSGLDQYLKEQMRNELREIFTRLTVATIVVTHDPVDAYNLADTVVIMRAGCLLQSGACEAVYLHPSNADVCRMFGGGSRFSCARIESEGYGRSRLFFPNSSQYIELDSSWPEPSAIVVLRPEACTVSASGSSRRDIPVLRGVVKRRCYHGATSDYFMDIDGTVVQARAPGGMKFFVGQAVSVELDLSLVHVFPS